MPAELAPYVHFDGNCRAAIDFYVEHLGATVEVVSTYADVPAGEGAPQGEPNWILYSRLSIAGHPVMMSDAPSSAQEKRQGFNLALTLETPQEVERIYAVLAEGGTVRMPIGQTFFAERFAMVTDRFGMPWMLSSTMAGG